MKFDFIVKNESLETTAQNAGRFLNEYPVKGDLQNRLSNAMNLYTRAGEIFRNARRKENRWHYIICLN